MKTAAAYARFSTDKQDRTSCDQQFRNIRRLAKREELRIVDTFKDAELSGALKSRPGFDSMMTQLDRFDAILIDDTSRITRAPGELAKLVAVLQFNDCELIAVHGFDSRHDEHGLLAGVNGAMDAAYLKKLAQQTHRGLEQRAESGSSAGGRSYGYTSKQLDDGTWQKVVYKRTAKIALEIGTRYANGDSLAAIMQDLNDRGVPSPGATWNRTGEGKTTSGRWTRSALFALIRNPLYRGTVIWNRCEWRKNPETGKRKRIERPRDEWIEHQDEDLRIWPEDLCQRIDARLASTSASDSDGRRRARKKGVYLLSGILKCECGASMHIVSAKGLYKCSAAIEGNCDNKAKVYRREAEQLLFTGIADKLLSPERIKLAEKEMKRQMAKAPKSDLKRQLTGTERKINNLAEAVAESGGNATLYAKLSELETERDRLRVKIDREGTPTPINVKSKLRDLKRLIRSIPTGDDLDEGTRAEIRAVLLDWLGTVPVSKNGDAQISLNVAADLGGSGGALV